MKRAGSPSRASPARRQEKLRARQACPWLFWMALVVASLCVASTVLHVMRIRATYDPYPFYRDYSALRTWIVNTHDTHGQSLRVSAPSSPWLQAWQAPASLHRDDLAPRRDRYRFWPYQMEEVHCACSVSRKGSTPSSSSSSASSSSYSSRAGTNTTLVSVFIHGNAGSAQQGDYWSCAVRLRHEVAQAVGAESSGIQTFAVALAEQANVHRGDLLRRQADFVADGVGQVVAALAAEGRSARVWLVGHSMGGTVARLAAALLAPLHVEGVLTFNTPHLHPPLFMDASMSHVYTALRAEDEDEDEGTRRTALQTAQRHHNASATATDSNAWIRRRLATRTRTRTTAQPPTSSVPHTTNNGNNSGKSSAHTKPLSTRLISVTSGNHDVQIARGTTALYGTTQPSTSLDLRADRLWLDARVWCDDDGSHDGVLLSPCVQALATAALLTPSSGTAAFVKRSVPASEQTPPWYTTWGAHDYDGLLWPVAACLLALYVQCAALQTGAFAQTAPRTVLVFMSGRVLGLVLRGTGLWWGAASPWPWDAWRGSVVLLVWRAVVEAPLRAYGQVATGLVAGVSCVRLAQALVGLVALCARQSPSRGHSRPRRHVQRVWPMLCGLAYVFLLVTDLGDVTTRVTCLLVACVVWAGKAEVTTQDAEPARSPLSSPSSRHETLTTAVRVAAPGGTGEETCETSQTVLLPTKSRDASGAGAGVPRALCLYGAMLLLHLQPFFVVRNRLISHTPDSRVLVDPRFRWAELWLLACLGATVWMHDPVEVNRLTSVRSRRRLTRSRVLMWVSRCCHQAAWLTTSLAYLGLALCGACVLDPWRAPVAFLFAVPEMLRRALAATPESTSCEEMDSPLQNYLI